MQYSAFDNLQLEMQIHLEHLRAPKVRKARVLGKFMEEPRVATRVKVVELTASQGLASNAAARVCPGRPADPVLLSVKRHIVIFHRRIADDQEASGAGISNAEADRARCIRGTGRVASAKVA